MDKIKEPSNNRPRSDDSYSFVCNWMVGVILFDAFITKTTGNNNTDSILSINVLCWEREQVTKTGCYTFPLTPRFGFPTDVQNGDVTSAWIS